jgi:hypothetical protein
MAACQLQVEKAPPIPSGHTIWFRWQTRHSASAFRYSFFAPRLPVVKAKAILPSHQWLQGTSAVVTLDRAPRQSKTDTSGFRWCAHCRRYINRACMYGCASLCERDAEHPAGANGPLQRNDDPVAAWISFGLISTGIALLTCRSFPIRYSKR